jgi:hypothetical protein
MLRCQKKNAKRGQRCDFRGVGMGAVSGNRCASRSADVALESIATEMGCARNFHFTPIADLRGKDQHVSKLPIGDIAGLGAPAPSWLNIRQRIGHLEKYDDLSAPPALESATLILH